MPGDDWGSASSASVKPRTEIYTAANAVMLAYGPISKFFHVALKASTISSMAFGNCLEACNYSSIIPKEKSRSNAKP